MSAEKQDQAKETDLSFSCPRPISDYQKILLGHGSGGKMTHQLIKNLFLPEFRNRYLEKLNDQATFELNGLRLAFTTDSFVVSPLFFPGGDIGKLSINGTVNDLAMSGARPLFISAAFILEEGFSIEKLQRIVRSMREACEEAQVLLVTGDTKVVNKGKGDGVFITTSGVGVIEAAGPQPHISADQARPGDKVIISGPIGDHGIAIMSVREGIEFETELVSDTAPLWSLVESMLEVSLKIHCLRDPTRGGLSSALNEIAAASKAGILLDEAAIPIRDEVRGACELLGLDPLYVANEGALIAVVAPEDAKKILERMRAHPQGKQSAIIGEVIDEHAGMVLLRSKAGGTRVVDMLAGEQLPRIC